MHKVQATGCAPIVKAWNEGVDIYLKMIAPVTPHMAEELWERLGKPYSIHTQSWPLVDEEATTEDALVIPVQVNGKVRERITVQVDATDEEIKTAALHNKAVQKHLDGKLPKTVIYVRGRLVNIVV